MRAAASAALFIGVSMTSELARISAVARKAVQKKDWATVAACASSILETDGASAEGHFLTGLAEKAAGRPTKAATAFEQALAIAPERYDAAVELANQRSIARRNGEAADLLARYTRYLDNSPRYLDMAGTVYSDIGMPERAWPLYVKTNELQPGIDLFQANLAACAVFLGKIDEAKAIYTKLLEKYPAHQRNHYQLARLEKAKDATHVEQMEKILRSTNLAPNKNIFLYYALAKELEDLERWDEAFRYYKMAGDAATSVARYDVTTDIALIDKVIEVCDAEWLAQGAIPAHAAGEDQAAARLDEKTPIFIVGLPRTGTTLTERILSSHSQVESVGETLFMQMVLRRESGVESVERMTPAMIETVAGKDMERIGAGYLDAVRYRLGAKPMFIDKYPENFLYLGFIAKALPNAHIVHLRRNPMDACFAMYKQVFTWAYKFSYTLEGLGRYYVAYDRLVRHWRATLGSRFVEVEYEALVADQESQTRALLERLGLGFEQACLDFEKNVTASTTASSVQVREKIHTRSVDRWRHFARHLVPLRAYLESAGIPVK
jgi:tetratricopeptide (TPR) repeat protein